MKWDNDKPGETAGGVSDEFASAFDEFSGDQAAAAANPGGEAKEAAEENKSGQADDQPEPLPGDTGTDPDNKDQPGATAPGDVAAAQGGDKGDEAKPDTSGNATDQAREQILAGLTPEARALFEESEAARLRAEKSAESQKGRVSKLNRQLAALKPSLPDTSAMLESDAIKSARNDYAEVVDPVLEVVKSQGEAIAKVVDALHDTGINGVLDENEDALASKHPDWFEVAGKPEFTNWLQEQPQYVRDVIARNNQAIVDPDGAADVIGRFKEFAGITPPPVDPNADAAALEARRRRLLASGADVPNKGPGVASGVPDTFEDAFEHFADKV